MKALAPLAVLLVLSALTAREPAPRSVRFAATPIDELFAAIATGDAAKVKNLLDADPKLAAQKNPQGFTPLHSAAGRDSAEIVKLLLGAKADINARGPEDFTPLYLAAINGSTDVVKLLIDRGADVSAGTKGDRFTPLHRAAQRGHIAIITLLLANGAAVDAGWHPKEFYPSITPLTFAVREGRLDAARLLLAKGATVDPVGLGYGRTPLAEAVERHDSDLVKLLLRKGADPNQKAALYEALRSGKSELIQLFVAKKPDFKTDPQLLTAAASSGKKEVVALVLAGGIVLTDSENVGISALVYAARAGHTEIVRLLLEKHVDPNIIGKEYTTPLHVAATKEIGEQLLAHKAKIDEPDKQGASPLLAAVQRGNRAVAELLSDNGAKHTAETLAALGRDEQLKARLEKQPLPKEKSAGRFTALHWAASFGEVRTARVLLDAGADVNATGPMDETPLHFAATHGHLPVVELLLERKADVNAKMKQPSFSARQKAYYTPLMGALEAGHADVVRALAKAGGLPAIDGAKNATALLSAVAANKRLGIVKLLIEQGAPADAKLPPNNGTALHLAAEEGELEMVKWLVAKKLDLTSTDSAGWTPLLRASAAGRTDVVKFLLAQGAQLDDNALFPAAANGHVALVELLLESGAKPDAVSVGLESSTVLGHAAASGRIDVVKLLHEKGASVKKDTGVLHAAAFRGHREVVAFLLEKGVDVEEARPDGFHLYYWTFQPHRLSLLTFFAETDPKKFVKGQNTSVTIAEINDGKPCAIVGGRPLQAAVAGKQKAVAALLLEKGASPNVLFPDGSTLLHMAAARGDAEMAVLLLKHGAPLDVKDRNGRTALALAVERDEDEIAALLRKHGAKQ
jgi:ankyrin repeat protein